MTNQNEAVLRAYLTEQLRAEGVESSETLLDALCRCIELEEGDSIESEETRTVHLSEASDGEPLAKSIKLYNMMKISYNDLAGFILDQLEVFLVEDNRIKAIMSVFKLFKEFYPKITHTFNKMEAGILLALYESGKKQFQREEIAGIYQSRFGNQLSNTQVGLALDVFVELKVLKALKDGQFELREKMVYNRPAK